MKLGGVRTIWKINNLLGTLISILSIIEMPHKTYANTFLKWNHCMCFETFDVSIEGWQKNISGKGKIQWALPNWKNGHAHTISIFEHRLKLKGGYLWYFTYVKEEWVYHNSPHQNKNSISVFLVSKNIWFSMNNVLEE